MSYTLLPLHPGRFSLLPMGVQDLIHTIATRLFPDPEMAIKFVSPKYLQRTVTAPAQQMMEVYLSDVPFAAATEDTPKYAGLQWTREDLKAIAETDDLIYDLVRAQYQRLHQINEDDKYLVLMAIYAQNPKETAQWLQRRPTGTLHAVEKWGRKTFHWSRFGWSPIMKDTETYWMASWHKLVDLHIHALEDRCGVQTTNFDTTATIEYSSFAQDVTLESIYRYQFNVITSSLQNLKSVPCILDEAAPSFEYTLDSDQQLTCRNITDVREVAVRLLDVHVDGLIDFLQDYVNGRTRHHREAKHTNIFEFSIDGTFAFYMITDQYLKILTPGGNKPHNTELTRLPLKEIGSSIGSRVSAHRRTLKALAELTT